MTEQQTPAVDTALAYHRAWTAGDLDAALAQVADDVVCHAPPGTLTGTDALRGFMGPFAGSLTSSTLLAAFGDEDQVLIMYDTANPAVPSAPGAELYRVRDGRIAEIRIVFDRLPFALARGDVVQA
ncbi:nuclear transport factor 2 family protein [Nocardioides marmotae]|uniref:nuclear transport factor 2 family protein n=1 Tax=Nocardioides marmotae TaxID=2663857 RepID=UPI0012B55B77|nr:nuclear transport factor 2 family protein [Nocardioides marmotae]MBC9734599.1 nuclear transport factor 2 family protein [Nocardioides marmotae]MTB85700.1 nuclear transport factor 2 family protein [Nocardioides marmotae]